MTGKMIGRLFIICILSVSTFNAFSQNQHKKTLQTKSVIVGIGWAKNSVNTVVFRRNSLVTYKNTQFIAYYNTFKQLVIGKRKIGSKKWELNITQYKGDASDAHKSISIIVDGHGYLHISWDHHVSPLRYCRSVKPYSLQLTDEMPMTGIKERKVTYPEFYRLPNGDLLFLYRDGSSGNGNLMLNHFDVKGKKWTQLQAGWISGEGNRNPYWQMTTDKFGTIHISWVWRETPDVSTNHDMCYAKSTDGGKTWEKSTGGKYILPITQNTAEYAAKIPQKSGLINTTSIATDNMGQPYMATYWRPSGSDVPQYQLIYNNGKEWVTQQISDRTMPFSLSGGGTKRIPISRPQLIIKDINGMKKAIMIYRDEERGGKVSAAICNDLSKSQWHVEDLTAESVGSWEPTYDTELWKQKDVLHLFIQKVEQGDGETMKALAPQPISVLQWKPSWK